MGSPDARTIEADVARSGFSWDVHTGIREAVLSKKRMDLSEVMHAVLLRHPGKLSYFQGFHDMTLVFLEVGSPSQAFHMVERLALFCLSDQLCCPFDKGLTPLLGVLSYLLELLDAPVIQALDEADCRELHFAVPWVLTWFAHSLPKLQQQVMRLFDCLLSSHPVMILYFAAALILQNRTIVLSTPRELPDMVQALQSLRLDNLDADDWALEAQRLAQRLPPEEFMAQLPVHYRRTLPPTSPLFHYPYPWRLHGKAEAMSAGEISARAPVYRNGASRSVFHGKEGWPSQAPLWRFLFAPFRFLISHLIYITLAPVQALRTTFGRTMFSRKLK